MINYEYFDLFFDDSKDKQFEIEYGGGTITNEDLFSESIEITESICSEDRLRFGCCEASSIKFKTANIFTTILEQKIKVKIVIDGNYNNPLSLGEYKVHSDKLTADRMWREVEAYDAMQDIINADVAAWYNSVLPKEESYVTLSIFRSKFAEHFGLKEVLPDGGLANDTMIVRRTIQPEEISGRDILFAICEINGCFGHIGRDGKLHYIYLPQAIQGLYPADDLFPDRAPDYLSQSRTGHLYPQDPKGKNIGAGKNYIECKYEDFITPGITHIQIRGDENDVGYIYYPSDYDANENGLYIIEDNFLVYGKTNAELELIASRLFGRISDITYRPYNPLKIRANPCLEVGDVIRLETTYHAVESYILQRTMHGIQAFMDTFSASGSKDNAENVNSVRKSIVQLKGKTNTLERTSEETRSELKDLEANTESKFVQTAEKIEAEVTRATAAEGVLTTNLSITAEGLRSEVTRAQGAEATLSSSISQNASQILLKVSKGDVSSQLSVEHDQVTITGNRLVVDSTNFKLDANGNAKFSGTVISDSITAIISFYITTAMSGQKARALHMTYESRYGGEVLYVGDGDPIQAIIFDKDIYANGNIDTTGRISADGAINSSTGVYSEGYPVITTDNIRSYMDDDFVRKFEGDSTSGVYNSIRTAYGSSIGGSGSEKYILGSKISYSDLADRLGGSDRRIKERIKPLEGIQGVYMAFSPVEYYFKPGLKEYSKRKQYGLIAQDAEKVLESNGILDSGIAYKKKSAEDLNENLYTDGETYKIDYKQLHAMHIYMVQEHQREIESLRAEMAAMRGQIEILRKQMEEMKNVE